MIKLYSLYTESHRGLKERFFDPTLPPDVELHMTFCDIPGEGRIQDPGWRRAIVRKVQVIVAAIKENWGKVFVYSDVDVQFFRPISESVAEAMRNDDLSFQIDAPGPCLCAGFFFCRGNETTLALWERISDGVCRAGEDDQAMLRKLVWQIPGLRWTCLPPVFCGGGTFTGRQWLPGREQALPEGLLMHHANFTIGVGNKVLLSESVQELVRAGRFIPLKEAYERVKVRGGFEFAPQFESVVLSGQQDGPKTSCP